MNIRKANTNDRSAILHVHQEAFGDNKGVVISRLVDDLLQDPTAKPGFSLVAMENDNVIGHILFTKVTVKGAGKDLSAQILAPLAVLPGYQNQGVGCQLINTGLDALRKSGIKLVFVLGHPEYYPRCGFTPAGIHGLEAPYPIPAEHADAWMVQELCPGILDAEKGRVECSVSLQRPEHWRE